MRKALFFANTDWYLYNFRLSLAKQLRQNGWNLLLASPSGAYGPQLVRMGFKWIPIDFSSSSTNPFAEFSLIKKIFTLYRQEKPDLCHHFTIKCVLYGSIAARLAGVPWVINAVTGLGHIFTDDGLKARLLRPLVQKLYRFTLSNQNTRVIFQNEEDRFYFTRNRLVQQYKTALIRGSGVDCRRFHPASPPKPDKSTETVNVLFASRLLKEKGIFELIEAARALKTAGEKINFILAGDIYPGNPSSLTRAELGAIQREGLIDYRGHVDDMPPLIADSDIVVLPSYREGAPRILIEAAAAGKPIIATDIAGCQNLVRHGKNGILVPVKSVPPLTEAIRTLAYNSDLRNKMGIIGRRIALEEFGEDIVLSKTTAVYNQLLSNSNLLSRPHVPDIVT